MKQPCYKYNLESIDQRCMKYNAVKGDKVVLRTIWVGPANVVLDTLLLGFTVLYWTRYCIVKARESNGYKGGTSMGKGLITSQVLTGMGNNVIAMRA